MAQITRPENERAAYMLACTRLSSPMAAISAVTQSTLVVLLLNVVFAYLVFGVVLFGLVTAEL